MTEFNFIVLCKGRDGWHYLVEATGANQEAALERVRLQQNPYQILAVTDGDHSNKGMTKYRGRLHTANRSNWFVGGAF